MPAKAQRSDGNPRTSASEASSISSVASSVVQPISTGAQTPVATTTSASLAPETNLSPPTSAAQSAAPTTNSGDDSTPNSSFRIILIDRDIKKPASFITQMKSYQLDISSNVVFFIGAVQLKTSKGNSEIFDLIHPVSCLQAPPSPNPCEFYDPNGRQNITAVKYRPRRDLANAFNFSELLDPIPESLDPEKTYTIEVVWAATQSPMLPDIRRNDAINPYDTQPMEFRVESSGAADPGLTSPTSPPSSSETGDKTKDNTAPGKSSAAESSATSLPGGGGGGRLGTGAKAGIAVGAVLGILAILALIFLCVRRRKSKRATAGGYFGDAPGSNNDIREKEAGVGIAAIPVSSSSTSDGNRHSVRPDAALIGRGNSARVVDGATMERGDGVGRHATTGHAAATPVAAAGAPTVARKPIGSRTVSDEERGTERNGAISAHSQVLSDEERARWEEEERRLDEDIAEAERRRLA